MAKHRLAGRKRQAGTRDNGPDSRGSLGRAPAPPPPPLSGQRGLFNTRGLAARPRIAALIIVFIGYVLTEVNRETVRNERHFYPMLMLFGPACILFGLGGAVDPRIMSQAGIQEPRVRLLFRAIMIILVSAGMAIGWAMAHFWYKIW